MCAFGRAQGAESGRVQAAVLEPCKVTVNADLTGGAGDVQVPTPSALQRG